ncbi:VPRE2 protein, partial [Amia calva]|nr:VPRE2 protein [Amia calva]
GVGAQPVLTQTASVSASPGGTAQIPCTIAGGNSGGVSYYCVYWYQQRQGKIPRYLLNYHSSISRGTGTPDRFSASKDSSRNICHLSVSNVQVEDYADYYCKVWDDDSNFSQWCRDPELCLCPVVSGASSPPSLTLLMPSPRELESQDKATLVCLVENFFPKAVTVTWKADGRLISTGVLTAPAAQRSDNSFCTSSLLTLAAAEWRKHGAVSCEVS